MSDETTLAMLQGKENFAHYKGCLVWLRPYNASVILNSEKDHMDLKVVCNHIVNIFPQAS